MIVVQHIANVLKPKWLLIYLNRNISNLVSYTRYYNLIYLTDKRKKYLTLEKIKGSWILSKILMIESLFMPSIQSLIQFN